jgi:N-acyl homoserine lactone hydrolase
MKALLALGLFLPLYGIASAAAELTLWRLDCGRVHVPDAGFLSDQPGFAGKPRDVSVGCYLLRHGEDYLLWDAGLPLSRLGAGGTSVGGGPARLDASLVDQLQAIGVSAAQVGRVALSHYHADHAGQIGSFPHARLLIGAEDLAAVRANDTRFNLDRALFAHWLQGGGEVDAITGDRDVFGDGRVRMLATPGHTPGHHVLLVELASGPVLLSGDLWHFHEQVLVRGVPRINTDAEQTRASMAQVAELVARTGAKLILQHEPSDIARLPVFPQAAR